MTLEGGRVLPPLFSRQIVALKGGRVLPLLFSRQIVALEGGRVLPPLFSRQIVALEGGRVRQQGTLKQIEAAEPELVSRWQELIRLDRQQETKEAAGNTRTALERWRLIQVVQKSFIVHPGRPSSVSGGDWGDHRQWDR